MSVTGKAMETESRLVVARDWELTANGYKVSLWGDENVLELDNGGGCPTL